MEQVFTLDELVDILRRERRLFHDDSLEFHAVLRECVDALLHFGTQGEFHVLAQLLKELKYRPSAGGVAIVATNQTHPAPIAE